MFDDAYTHQWNRSSLSPITPGSLAAESAPSHYLNQCWLYISICPTQKCIRLGSTVSGTSCAWAISITDHLDRIHLFDRGVSCSNTNAWSDFGSLNDLRKYYCHYNGFCTWQTHVYVWVEVCRIPIIIHGQGKRKMIFLSRCLCSVFMNNNDIEKLPLRMFLASIRYNNYH